MEEYKNKNNELIEQINGQTANYEELLNKFNTITNAKHECIKSIEEYITKANESHNNIIEMELQLVHVKEKKARLAERKRRQNRKSMIQKPQKSF